MLSSFRNVGGRRCIKSCGGIWAKCSASPRTRKSRRSRKGKRNFVGQHFRARGFFVNTVGRDEEAIRAYIRNQEKEDQRLDQLDLWR